MRANILSMFFLSVMGLSVAYAECTHLPLAIEHTRLSLKESESGKLEGTPLLVSNLSNSLEQARASEKAEKNVHTEKAVTELESALNFAKANQGKECHMRIQEAMKHLELAGQCPAK